MSATLHRKLSPALFDIPIEHIGRALADNIPWLSEVYGKAEAITHTLADGTRPVWPDWPMEGNEYITLLPDDRDGGYAFFVLDEPVSLEHDGGKWHAPLSLVVWGDMLEASPAERNTEAAKEAVLRALRKVRIPGGRFIVETVYERPASVFRGFSLRETDNRFMTQPFFALRFSGTVYIDEPCEW